MRATLRLFAKVKTATHLTPYTPTGFTGLATHPAPRSTLLYLYSTTLEKLKAFPESSAYRQSTEALTQHRLKIIESVKPAGYDEWVQKAAKQMSNHPDAFKASEGGQYKSTSHNKRQFISMEEVDEDDDDVEWDGEKDEGPELEGTYEQGELDHRKAIAEPQSGNNVNFSALKEEPQLDAAQVSEVESQIGAGLIEEVIEVAEGELKLVDVMAEHKVWEDLEEKPAEGQWKYFERHGGPNFPTG
ncbi:MAG: hypothetical protein M1824_003702 [Vezdaea acicularis]|nr:MAG: hypothetical protein M1824_003702 [Vezdaea acicularis]